MEEGVGGGLLAASAAAAAAAAAQVYSMLLELKTDQYSIIP